MGIKRMITGGDAATDDKAADILARRLGDEFLHEEAGLQVAEGRDDRLRGLARLGQHDAFALAAFQKLDHERRAARQRDEAVRIAGRGGRGGARHADAVGGQHLMGAQLVAAGHQTVGPVQAPDAHCFELAQDGGAVIGDRGTDAWDNDIIVGQSRAPQMQARARGVDGDADAGGVKNIDGMAARLARLDHAAG